LLGANARKHGAPHVGASVAKYEGMNQNNRYSLIALAAAAVLSVAGCNKTEGGSGSTSTTAAPAASAGQAYTCPMDPEVVHNGPGRCPKCGMALVPKAGGAP
jgi:hypothetical protein